jgi:predicted NAD/FAD-dependent oxidoreductase
MKSSRHYAIIGAGMAGIACARTLAQAGHRVTVFEQEAQAGGRMATLDTAYGSFDTGVQYFTVRDPRFERALKTSPGLCRPWSANAVRVLDPHGRVVAASLPARESHWVAVPGMNALLQHWAHPLHSGLLPLATLHLRTRVHALERDAQRTGAWQLRTEGPHDAPTVHAGFDGVVLALPPQAAQQLLRTTPAAATWNTALSRVQVAPCWTLTLAYPQAMQAGMQALGPQWNVARSTHHRIAWLARESSKPQRSPIERWTVQANPDWSQEHRADEPERVQAKLIKAFGEITGIRTEPTQARAVFWPQAQTVTPLGSSHLWDAALGVGVCGDWCLGHRVEDAFISGLELALQLA